MRIASATYPVAFLGRFSAWQDKLSAWVAEAAGQGAELLVFPEYAGMELASFAGPEASADPRGCIEQVSMNFDKSLELQAELAAEHDVHILTGSAPVIDGDRTVNRAALIAPSGAWAFQDKQIMVPFERDPWQIAPGGPLRLFDTALGRIGVLICYDCEFPLLARALREADVILVPSCTETFAGYWRVRVGAMARALETQCVTVQSSLVSGDARLWAVEENTGAAGIYAPPDTGFPPTGVLALADRDAPGWTLAEADPAAIARVRSEGTVRNRAHWPEQAPRGDPPETVTLR